MLEKHGVSARLLYLFCSSLFVLFFLESTCPDLWCASEKKCFDEHWMCNGWKQCTDGSDEPDNCGKVAPENYPTFLFWNHTLSKLIFKTIFETSRETIVDSEFYVLKDLLKGTKS